MVVSGVGPVVSMMGEGGVRVEREATEEVCGTAPKLTNFLYT